MNAQEQQVIEALFARIRHGAAQAGPRDAGAEALIEEKLRTFPTAPYYLGRRWFCRSGRCSGPSSGSARSSSSREEARSLPRRDSSPELPRLLRVRPAGAGFLAGAAQLALGIGGGILVAEAATSLAHGIFGGGFGGFGGYDGDEAAFEHGYDAGPQNDQQGWGTS